MGRAPVALTIVGFAWPLGSFALAARERGEAAPAGDRSPVDVVLTRDERT
jgi:hypothetical protein